MFCRYHIPLPDHVLNTAVSPAAGHSPHRLLPFSPQFYPSCLTSSVHSCSHLYPLHLLSKFRTFRQTYRQLEGLLCCIFRRLCDPAGDLPIPLSLGTQVLSPYSFTSCKCLPSVLGPGSGCSLFVFELIVYKWAFWAFSVILQFLRLTLLSPMFVCHSGKEHHKVNAAKATNHMVSSPHLFSGLIW